MIALWTLVFVVGLVAASLASRRAVTHALDAAAASNVSAGFIGLSVLAIGTDLPEIANSIISAATGHGDLAVGDTAGSALTQVTLVLGILCVATMMTSDRRSVPVTGVLTSLALVGISMLIRDGEFSRTDGLVLVVAWVVALFGLKQLTGAEPATSEQRGVGFGRAVGFTAAWLAVVAVAATLVVQSFVEITEALGVPELLAGAVLLALGTSLPELIVDWTAVRRGAGALALGDLFGSSLLDATLAIGIGPALTPTVVSSEAATMCLIAAGGVLAATATVSAQRSLGRGSAAILVAIYLAATISLLTVAG